MAFMPILACEFAFLLVNQAISYQIYVPFSHMEIPKQWFLYIENSVERSITMREKSPNFLSSFLKAIYAAKRDTMLQHKVLHPNE